MKRPLWILILGTLLVAFPSWAEEVVVTNAVGETSASAEVEASSGTVADVPVAETAPPAAAAELAAEASADPDATASDVAAAEAVAAPPADALPGLDEEVQALKQEVLDLNRELFALEEELLFPTSTQVALFLSMDVGSFFALDSVQVKVDDKVVASYLYTEREVAALRRGGVHRIYTGNLRSGDHEVVALFTGKGPNDRDYRRGATRTFTKGLGPKFLELQIVDQEAQQQPEFLVKEWE